MKLAVVNESAHPSVTRDALERICAALRRQITENFAPFWQAAPVELYLASSLRAVGADDSIVAILDDADAADALGYHDVTPDGRAFAKVFVHPILMNGGTIMTGANSLSVTIGHEALETDADPYASWWADGPDGYQYALEACDAVEGDSYEIDGVAVSNFVGPRFFRPGAGPYDWMRLLTEPFAMTAGGYQILRKNGKTKQIFALGHPEWKAAGRTHAAARLSRRMK